jgi:hypothetical protein
MSFMPGLEVLLDLAVAFLHRQQDGGLVLERQVLEANFLPGPMPMLASLARIAFFLGAGRRELQREVQVLEEVGLHHLLVDLREVDRRRAGGAAASGTPTAAAPCSPPAP